MRRFVSTASALVAALSGSAEAQTPPHAACPPTFELADDIPARLAQRLRRVLDHATTALPTRAACQPSRARLEWNARELTLHISLDDGRMAVRSLESLEDVLPTLLSVLAVPAPEPESDDPPPAEPPAPPPPPVAPAPLPAAIVAPARSTPTRPAREAWSLLVSGTFGSSYSDGDLAGRWSAEVGAATPRLALSLRAATSFAHPDNDNNAADGGPIAGRETSRGLTQSSMVLSARARWSFGRFTLEAGGFGGVSHNAAAEPSRWLPRLGVEAALGWRFTRSLSVFARTESSIDVGAGGDPSMALSLGLACEPHR